MKHTLECIKGDKQSLIYRDWLPWLLSAEQLYMRCLKEFEFRPFHDCELAAVSLLSGAANRIGYLSVCESEVDKGKKLNGRGDLWMVVDDRQYWFEFKRSDFKPEGGRWPLRRALKGAMKDINEFEFENDEIGVAGVIAARNGNSKADTEVYSKFSELVDYTFSIGQKTKNGAYLFLKIEKP